MTSTRKDVVPVRRIGFFDIARFSRLSVSLFLLAVSSFVGVVSAQPASACGALTYTWTRSMRVGDFYTPTMHFNMDSRYYNATWDSRRGYHATTVYLYITTGNRILTHPSDPMNAPAVSNSRRGQFTKVVVRQSNCPRR